MVLIPENFKEKYSRKKWQKMVYEETIKLQRQIQLEKECAGVRRKQVIERILQNIQQQL